MPKVDGFAVAAIGVGTLFAYSGLKGKNVLLVTQSLIQGGNPATTAQTNAIETPNISRDPSEASGLAGAEAGSATGGAIAAKAQTYVGDGYVFAGAPAKGDGHWDCSSFVNKVFGIDFGLAIPTYKAGKYTGSSHGPTAAMWFAWSGCETISHDGNDAQPGDLCCWQTHIGIAIGGGKMVSARSAHSNPPTGINTINGDIKGEYLAIRRYKGL